MVSRSLLALFALALFFAVASAVPKEEVDNQDEERSFKEVALKAYRKALKEVGKHSNLEVNEVNCVSELSKFCHINVILHPRKFHNCARKFVLEHKELCFNKQ